MWHWGRGGPLDFHGKWFEMILFYFPLCETAYLLYTYKKNWDMSNTFPTFVSLQKIGGQKQHVHDIHVESRHFSLACVVWLSWRKSHSFTNLLRCAVLNESWRRLLLLGRIEPCFWSFFFGELNHWLLSTGKTPNRLNRRFSNHEISNFQPWNRVHPTNWLLSEWLSYHEFICLVV